MPLFVARHRHSPEACPASAEMGPRLLAHVSAANAVRYSVAIHAEAVVEGEHDLILILRAPDRKRVEEFMEFFTQLGEVQIRPACSAEEVVDLGGCGAKLDPRAEVMQVANDETEGRPAREEN